MSARPRLRAGALWHRGLPQASAALAQRWARLSARERRLVVVAAVTVAVAVLWLALIRPAWRTLQTAPAQIVELQQTLQGVQRIGQQITALRNAPPVAPFHGDLQAAITAWFEREDAAAKVQAQVLPGEATLTVQGLRPAVLVALVQAARRDWSAQVDAADLQRGPDGLLRGSVHLLRHGGG